MRFLMLNWRDPENPQAGGAERVSLAYLAALAERGHDVHWVAHAFRGAAPQTLIRGVRIVRKGNALTSMFGAMRWVRRQPPFDLVIDQHHGLPWFAPWWTRSRVVAYIHEVLGPIWESFYPWPLSALGKRMESGAIRAYRKVPFWTASSFTASKLAEMGIESTRRIPYGVDTPARTPLPAKRLSPPLRLIAISRLAPNKRLDHAVRVLPLLQDRGIAADLTIVGDGACRRSLEELAARTGGIGRIEFAGRVPEERKLELLDSSDLLIHTSVREGWGLNVIEANLRGVPAVVYPVPGLIESTVRNRTGWVAPEETPEALAGEIEDALRDPDRFSLYRQAAWKKAREFRWERILPDACDWLEEQAGTPQSPR